MRRLPWALAGGLCLASCAALSDDLRRAEQAYEQAQYEDALVWLDDLEDDAPDMDVDQRARFYFLRGMTAYRLVQRNDALHYLALAREQAGEQGEGLRPEWRTSMDRTLTELMPTAPRSFYARSEATAGTAGGESEGETAPE